MADVRRWALSLPESTEQPHHYIGSFRVRGKIFATLPDAECVRIMVDEQEILAATASYPEACRPVYWGKRISCVAVDIAAAPADLIRDLLTDAWSRKAPAALAKTFTGSEVVGSGRDSPDSVKSGGETLVTVHDPRVLLARLKQLAEDLPFEVTSRPMMGGFIGYADERTFVSLSTGGFGIKFLPADQDRALARPGAARMRHSPAEPESKSYITFSEIDVADDDFMIEWLTLAARTAPGKKKR